MGKELSSPEKEAKKLIATAFGILLAEYSKYSVNAGSQHIYRAFEVSSTMLFEASSAQMKETQLPLWDQENLGL